MLTLTFLCRERQLTNVKIIVADISNFVMEDQFDRVISIEMFEVCDCDAFFFFGVCVC